MSRREVSAAPARREDLDRCCEPVAESAIGAVEAVIASHWPAEPAW